MANNAEYRQRIFRTVNQLTPNKNFDELELALANARGVPSDHIIDRPDVKKLLRLADVPTTLNIAENQLMREIDTNRDDRITAEELGPLLAQLPPAVQRLDLTVPGAFGVRLRRNQ